MLRAVGSKKSYRPDREVVVAVKEKKGFQFTRSDDFWRV
jgi:hypothetical protein